MQLATSELLALGLTELPKSRQGLESKAKRENWQFVEEISKGRNGTIKRYLIAALPPAIRDAVYAKLAQEKLAQSAQTPELPTSPNSENLSGCLKCPKINTKRPQVHQNFGAFCIEVAQTNYMAVVCENLCIIK